MSWIRPWAPGSPCPFIFCLFVLVSPSRSTWCQNVTHHTTSTTLENNSGVKQSYLPWGKGLHSPAPSITPLNGHAKKWWRWQHRDKSHAATPQRCVSRALHVLSSCVLCLAPPAVDVLEALGQREACNTNTYISYNYQLYYYILSR